jgi:hypothetical protein
MMRVKEDPYWLQNAAIQRKAQVSNVVMVETSDPFRQRQIIDFIRQREVFDSPSFFNFRDWTKQPYQDDPTWRIWLDPWEGLMDLGAAAGKIAKTDAVKIAPLAKPEIPLPPAQGQKFLQMPVLVYMDQVFKQYPTVLLITNVSTPDLARTLTIPLQNWNQSPHVRSNHSLIILLTPNVALFDEYTRKLSIIVSPPYSTEEERKTKIQEVVDGFSTTYDPEILRVSAGMTMHDLETALLSIVYQSRLQLIKTPHFTVGDIVKLKMEILRKSGLELVYPNYGFEASM